MKKVIVTTAAPGAIGPYSQAIDAALAASSPADTIFVGGSNFTVATLLEEYI